MAFFGCQWGWCSIPSPHFAPSSLVSYCMFSGYLHMQRPHAINYDLESSYISFLLNSQQQWCMCMCIWMYMYDYLCIGHPFPGRPWPPQFQLGIVSPKGVVLSTALKRWPHQHGNRRKHGALVVTTGVPVIILSIQTGPASNGMVWVSMIVILGTLLNISKRFSDQPNCPPVIKYG